MYSEVAWVLVSSRNQVRPQVILESDYLPDYLSISYDYDKIKETDHKMCFPAVSRKKNIYFDLNCKIS